MTVEKGRKLWRRLHPGATLDPEDLTTEALDSPSARGRAAWHARHGNTEAGKALHAWKLEQINDRADNVTFNGNDAA